MLPPGVANRFLLLSQIGTQSTAARKPYSTVATMDETDEDSASGTTSENGEGQCYNAPPPPEPSRKEGGHDNNKLPAANKHGGDNVVVNQEQHVIHHLSDNDVLLGRGTGPNEFIGNVRFRALVHQVLMRSCGTGDSFDTTATTSSCSSSRRTRTETTSTVSSPPAPANTSFSSIHARTGSKRVPLARQVVEMIKSRGGRFLERLRGEDSRYREVDDSIAIEKAKQSFRHQIRSTPAGQGQHRVRTTSSLHQNNKKRKRMADDEGAASASTANSRRASKYSRPVAQQTARGASSSVAAAFHNETTKILDQTAAVSPSTIATLVSRPLQLVVQPDGGNHRSTMILSPQVIQSLLRRGGGGQQEERIQQIRPMLLPPEVLEQEEAILRRASIAAALSREYSTLAGPPPGLLYPRELVYGAPLWNVADIISPLYDPFTAARWEARQRYLSREAMLLQANCNPLLSPLDEQALALALQQSPPR